MAANHRPDPADANGRFPVDPNRPIEIVVHNRSGAITVRGVDREDILLRSDAADGGDPHDHLQIGFESNRLEVRADPHGRHGGKAVREATRAAKEASREATRAAREASRATRDIFRRREGQFGKGPVTGSWQIDFDEHIRHELRDLLPFRGGGSYDLEIEVPRSGVEVRVEAHTATGDVRIEDVHGAVDVATASGDLVLKRVSGDLTVQTASGEIQINEPTGSLRARSASGDVDVVNGSLEQYVITTASGDIDLVATLIGAGPYRIDAVSGDVDLMLDAPDNILARGFTMPYKTVSGEGRVTGMRRINRRLWSTGDDGAGEIEIPVHTVSGDINVSLTRQTPSTPTATRPEDATIPLPPPVVVAAPPAPPAPPEPPTYFTDSITGSTVGAAERDAKEALTAEDWTFEEQDAAFVAQDAAFAAQDAAMTGDTDAVQAADETLQHGDALTRIADEMAASLARENFAPSSYPPAAPAETASAPAADATPNDRLMILAALEGGEIDIDEAMRRLDALPPTA